MVFKEGLPSEKLYLVKSGEVLCLKSSSDRLIPVFLAKAGDIIGESAMMDHHHYTYSGICLDNAELVEIASASFKEVFNDAPDWLLNLTSTMISRFENSSKLIAENRIIHSAIIEEDQFTSKREVEFKKLLG